MSKTPMYYSIYQKLQADIRSGHYPVGENLPTDKILADNFDVSVITIKKAMELLSNEGYVVRKPRKGTTVRDANPVKQRVLNTSHALFGLIVTNFTDFFGAGILRSILSTATDHTDFIVKVSYGNVQQEERAISELVSMGVQGLIILPASSEYASPKLLELTAKNFPVVVIDRLMGELPISSVKTDNEAAARALTDYLIDHGHTHIGMITSDSHVTTIDERISGFMDAHLRRQLPFSRTQINSNIDSVVPSSHVPIDKDLTKIKQFLLANPQLTAVVASEYNIALLIQQAATALGRKIPEDLSVVCFDSPAFNPYEARPFVFTHIQQDQEQLGKTAVKLLVKKCHTQDFVQKVTLGFKLIEGTSVANYKGVNLNVIEQK
ncbi:GntR family transcriptional regulator [Lacticaseibacillus jixiensis]|uniref:GntR family transcriptional regulator n=1 Tax=Lacticaseibacillus jixiensis TaxID=3231926 RepID=UPI0036F3919D